MRFWGLTQIQIRAEKPKRGFGRLFWIQISDTHDAYINREGMTNTVHPLKQWKLFQPTQKRSQPPTLQSLVDVALGGLAVRVTQHRGDLLDGEHLGQLLGEFHLAEILVSFGGLVVPQAVERLAFDAHPGAELGELG